MQIELDPLHADQRIIRLGEMIGLSPEEVGDAVGECGQTPYATILEKMIALSRLKRKSSGITILPSGDVVRHPQRLSFPDIVPLRCL